MAIYPIHHSKTAPQVLNGSTSFYSKEYAEAHLSLFLEDSITPDADGKLHKYFRLNASEPHSIEMALAYDVHCPCCSKMLKPVARMRNAHELFLYECPQCSK